MKKNQIIIHDLLGQSNVNITVTTEQLKEFAEIIVQKTKQELEEAVIADKAETYPSPKQVSELLHVDISTLWRWKNKGYLVPVVVGGKRRYKMSDVKAILTGEYEIPRRRLS